MVEITATEQNKEKRMKRNKESLIDVWNNIKQHPNIHIIGVPEREEKEKGPENIFEDIVAENLPNMRKETLTQVQEAQRIPYKMNTPRHILTKLTKIKDKKQN